MKLLDALQSALAAEQQIGYGYGVAGAHLAGRAQAYARDSLTAHRRRADQLAGLVEGAGAVPVTAAPAYGLPFPVLDAPSAQRLAGQLEAAGSGAAWDLVAASAAGSPARALAVAWATDAAVRTARWGRAVAPFPGQPT